MHQKGCCLGDVGRVGIGEVGLEERVIEAAEAGFEFVPA
jgi:hypothetical protein